MQRLQYCTRNAPPCQTMCSCISINGFRACPCEAFDTALLQSRLSALQTESHYVKCASSDGQQSPQSESLQLLQMSGPDRALIAGNSFTLDDKTLLSGCTGKVVWGAIAIEHRCHSRGWEIGCGLLDRSVCLDYCCCIAAGHC